MPHILTFKLHRADAVVGRDRAGFRCRDTGKEPSKSGVIGLLCAALGISRDEANAENPHFRRIDKTENGRARFARRRFAKDYHTAQNIAKADGGTRKTTNFRRVLSRRCGFCRRFGKR